MKITWVNFLHAYQPPWQTNRTLSQVVDQCYAKLFQFALRYPDFRFTLNISGCLTDLLIQGPHRCVIDLICELVERKQVELTGSAKYHPILPLLSPYHRKRQIQEQDAVCKKVFGSYYAPKGFYLPEMAVDQDVLNLIRDLGFEWVILDEISACDRIDKQVQYYTPQGLKVLFRDRSISKTYVPRTLMNKLSKTSNQETVFITATDAELYGHHHTDYEKVLDELVSHSGLKMSTCSDYLDSLKTQKKINIQTSSWESTHEDLQRKTPFALWRDSKNRLHRRLWGFVDKVALILEQYKEDPNHYWARKHFDRGMASCTFWWCSSRKPGVFSPITWHPEEIERGLLELIKAVRSLKSLSRFKKIRFEGEYFNIQHLIWKIHWSEKESRIKRFRGY